MVKEKNNMTLEQLITKQQLQIHEQEQQIKDLCKCISRIRTLMVCVGGPLNDNVHKYTDAQSLIFHRMDDVIEPVMDIVRESWNE